MALMFVGHRLPCDAMCGHDNPHKKTDSMMDKIQHSSGNDILCHHQDSHSLTSSEAAMSRLADKFPAEEAIMHGDTVRVYRNLNLGLLSVLKKVGKSWLVRGYYHSVTLTQCSVKLSASAQARARHHRQRNVHLYIQGQIVATAHTPVDVKAHHVALTYNPFTDDGLVYEQDPSRALAPDTFDVALIQQGRVYITP